MTRTVVDGVSFHIERGETLGVDGFLSLAEQSGIPLAAIAFYEAPMGHVCESQSNSLWLPGTDAFERKGCPFASLAGRA